MSYSIHEMPGRLRVRAPALADTPELVTRITATLAAIKGIEYVRHRPANGSLLILFDPSHVCPSRLINELVDLGLLEGVVAMPRTRRSRAPDLTPGAILGKSRVRTRTVAHIKRIWRTAHAVSTRHQLPPRFRRALMISAKLALPLAAERLLGRPGRALVSLFL